MAVCKKKVTHVRQRGYIVRVMIKLKIKIKIRVYEIKLPLYIDSVDCLGGIPKISMRKPQVIVRGEWYSWNNYRNSIHKAYRQYSNTSISQRCYLNIPQLQVRNHADAKLFDEIIYFDLKR